ncbi:uncharacterized protein LOC141890603 isoform X2 [Acropora palmata]|uniref:uncharacterized protein LOC141890603 isoform X2 n=1 Tax=Acropora palmata TaxID=6131 RepID=UPI003DA0E5BB
MAAECAIRTLDVAFRENGFHGSPLGLVRLVRNFTKKTKRATNRPEGISFAASSAYYGLETKLAKANSGERQWPLTFTLIASK